MIREYCEIKIIKYKVLMKIKNIYRLIELIVFKIKV